MCGPSGTSIHSREPVCRPSICHCQGPGSVGKRLSFLAGRAGSVGRRIAAIDCSDLDRSETLHLALPAFALPLPFQSTPPKHPPRILVYTPLNRQSLYGHCLDCCFLSSIFTAFINLERPSSIPRCQPWQAQLLASRAQPPGPSHACTSDSPG